MATDVGSIYARLYLDRSPFTRSLEEAKAEAAAFGDVVVPIDANLSRFDAASAEVFAAKRAMAEPVDTTVDANTAPFDLGAAQVSALKKALTRPVDIPVEIDASKLGLFKRLVGGGESPGDVARYLGFSKQELSSALGTLAMQAAEGARAQFSEAGAYAAEQMVAGWMAAAQRGLGSGTPITSGFYRLLTGGADPYMSTGGSIPMPPSDSDWRFWSPQVPPLGEIGPGGHVTGWGSSPPPSGPAWIPPALARGPEPLALGSGDQSGWSAYQKKQYATWEAYQKMYRAWEGTSGTTPWAEGPIPGSVVGDKGPGPLGSLLGFLGTRLGGRTGDNGSGGLGILAPIAAAGGIGALLTGLLWGGGSKGFMGFGAGMAGFGSLASFAGLGPEHLLMTGVGLAGNAVGGLLGGSLLGLGSLGVMGVGMGTDLAGIGQAANDIKAVTQAQNSLSQAVALYGANSRQAAQAQAQLNYTLSGFSPIARTAVLAAANTAQQFHQLFNQATGQAEKTGAQIIDQAMKVGEAFLPTIGKYAAGNLSIIETQLQPLFSWLKSSSGGLGIFQNLEELFQSRLPTAMHALTQGVELFMKTMQYAANNTGGFIDTVDKFVTKWNSPPNFARWEATMTHLFADFHQWSALLKILGADIYQLFHNDAGTGSAIVGTLTQMLTKLHAWETSTSGRNALHSMFAVHKQEVIDLLHLLPNLISVFGRLYLTVAPTMTEIVTDLARLVGWMQGIPGAGPLLTWAAAVGYLAAKVKLLGPLTGVLDRLFGYLAFGKGTTASGGMVASLKGLVGSLRGTETAVQDLATAPVVFSSMGGAARAAAADAETLGARVATAGEEAVAAGGRGGLGALALGAEGMLGPIGLAVGAIGIGLIPAFMGLLHSGPTAAQQTAKAVAAMNQQLAQIPAGTVLQMATKLDTVSQDMSKVGSAMLGLKPGSAALQIAAGKMSALYQASLSTTQQMATMQTNVDGLAKAFGISTSDVQNFAQQVGIDLKQKLDPTQVNIFGRAVAQSGQSFNKAATASTQATTTIARNLAKRVDAELNTNQQLNAAASEAASVHTAIMNKEGVAAIAALVNGTRGGLPAVEAAAQQYGVTIPKRYLDALQSAMLSNGKISMSKLAAGITSGSPVVGASIAHLGSGIHLQLKGALATAALDAGASLDSGLASGISANVQQVLGVTAMVAANIVGVMRKGLQVNSPSLIMAEIGHGVGEGLALGIARSSGLATDAAGEMAGNVAGVVNKHLNGMTFSGTLRSPGSDGTASRVAQLVATQEKIAREVRRQTSLQEQVKLQGDQIADLLRRFGDAQHDTAQSLTNLPDQVALLKRTGAL